MPEQDQVFRIRTERTPGTLAAVLAAIADHGATIGEIETITIEREHNVRDVTVIAPDGTTIPIIRKAIEDAPGVELLGEIDKVFAAHEGGKLAIRSTVEVHNVQDVREVYTPGVARVSQAIAEDSSLADRFTWRARTVAVVSDGSRCLGLGNIGPAAALPVMEGKALFYAMLVDLNAVPIVLATQDPDEIIEAVARIAPSFGAIHLEDIASPGVYRVEEELDGRLPVPVMHDDQHGTAVVVLAAVLSATRLLDRRLEDLTFGQVGLGAAGSAIAGLAMTFPFRKVLVFDPEPDSLARLEIFKAAASTEWQAMGFQEVLGRSDVLVLATGRPGLLDASMIRSGQIVFALSNPEPEIGMKQAEQAGAALAADGTIVNNVLGFPGLFRGALDAGATSITPGMRRAAARALAEAAPEGSLLPEALDRAVHSLVAERVGQAAG